MRLNRPRVFASMPARRLGSHVFLGFLDILRGIEQRVPLQIYLINQVRNYRR